MPKTPILQYVPTRGGLDTMIHTTIVNYTHTSLVDNFYTPPQQLAMPNNHTPTSQLQTLPIHTTTNNFPCY